MSGHLSRFPSGPAGIGLLILRLALAVGLIVDARRAFFPAAAARVELATTFGLLVAGLTLACALLSAIGFQTMRVHISVVVLALTLMGLQLTDSDATSSGNSESRLLIAAMAIAVVLIGPGSYSLDARLFGRREITIPPQARWPRVNV